MYSYLLTALPTFDYLFFQHINNKKKKNSGKLPLPWNSQIPPLGGGVSEVCGFAVFTYFFVRFLWHLPIFLAVFMRFAVSIIACGLRFFAKIWYFGFWLFRVTVLRFKSSENTQWVPWVLKDTNTSLVLSVTSVSKLIGLHMIFLLKTMKSKLLCLVC